MRFKSDVDLEVLLKNLVTRLRALKKYRDAATLAEFHLKDYELSGQCLIDGLFFSEAWALACRYSLKNWTGISLSNKLHF